MKSLCAAANRWRDRRSGSAAWSLTRGLSLQTRQSLAGLTGRRALPAAFKFEVAMGLLQDLHRHDPVALHRFLWSNHLAYAHSYETSDRFGADRINPTRHALFGNLDAHLRSRGLDPRKDIRTVLEIGCSQGYLLRHLELTAFHSATILHGIDIDDYAIRTGSAHLNSLGSRVELFAADMGSRGAHHRRENLRRGPVLRRADVRERRHRREGRAYDAIAHQAARGPDLPRSDGRQPCGLRGTRVGWRVRP